MAIEYSEIPEYDSRIGEWFILQWTMPNGKVAHNIPVGILFGEDGDVNAIPEDIVRHYIDQYNQEKINLDSLEYLRNTDWYVVRQQDSGTAIPTDIQTERAACRERIVRTEYSNW